MRIAVDFDGTIVEHKYPSIGKEKPFAVETLKQLSADGHQLILWTVRSGDLLYEAVKWCGERGLKFYAVNSDRPEGSLFASNPNGSPKVTADVFIDDSNLGGLPEWSEIYMQISGKSESLKHRSSRSHRHGHSHGHSKRPWWKRLFSRKHH